MGMHCGFARSTVLEEVFGERIGRVVGARGGAFDRDGYLEMLKLPTNR